MQGIKILGISSYVPETVITNDDFTSFIETSDEWITTRTGIKTRHCALDMPTWKIGSLAAKASHHSHQSQNTKSYHPKNQFIIQRVCKMQR